MRAEITRHVAFAVLLLLSSAYALARGGRPERIAATTLLCAALFSVAVARPSGFRFHHVESGLVLIDLVILGIFLWLSLRTTRFWPMWITALLGAEMIVHFGLLIAPETVPDAYRNAQAVWSWGAQIILAVATWRHQNRMARLGQDPPWKQ